MRPSRVRRMEETIRLLAELFPGAFTGEEWQQHRPLKIHVDADLYATGLLTRNEMIAALRHYCRRRMYLVVLTQGGQRFDLDGNVVGEVSPRDVEDARQQLAMIDAMREDRARNAKAERQRAREARQAQKFAEAFALRAAHRAAREAEAQSRAQARIEQAAAETSDAASAPQKSPPEKPHARLSSAAVGRLSLADLRAAALARRAAAETAA
jgi:sRNA-binding protein